MTRRHALRSWTVLGAAGATAAGLLTALPATPAYAAPARYADDFNGDGIRDYASYRLYSNTAGTSGAVLVTFGTPSGPYGGSQVIHQDSPGVPGTNEADDFFGSVRAAADFNGDGYGDLAVATPWEKVDGRRAQGWVTVLWGSPTGLSGGTSIPNRNPASFGRFGSDLATGDFNGDGRPDLAAINDGETYVYRGRIDRSGVAGSVTMLDRDREWEDFDATSLIAGHVNKGSVTDLVILGTATGKGVNWGRVATDAWFVRGGRPLHEGGTLRLDGNQDADETSPDGVIADFDRDGYGDIAIGLPGEGGFRGEVTVWRGTSGGPRSATRLTQATDGVTGTRQPYDEFGYSVSAGDTNGDGYPDLAVGAPGEKIIGVEYAGIAHVLRGGQSGLTGRGSQAFHRDTAGIPSSPDVDDSLGYEVRLRADPDAYDDLYINGINAAPVRLPGSSRGITTEGLVELNDMELVGGILQ